LHLPEEVRRQLAERRAGWRTSFGVLGATFLFNFGQGFDRRGRAGRGCRQCLRRCRSVEWPTSCTTCGTDSGGSASRDSLTGSGGAAIIYCTGTFSARHRRGSVTMCGRRRRRSHARRWRPEHRRAGTQGILRESSLVVTVASSLASDRTALILVLPSAVSGLTSRIVRAART
jgi:hypothetical protein